MVDSKRFLCRGRRWFLTYPQSDFDCPSLVEFVRKKVLPFILGGWCVASETHESGDLHRHMVFELAEGSRLAIRDCRFFDFEGRHPNIQLCKNWRASVIYLKKGGDFISGGFDVEACIKKKGKLCDEVAHLVAVGGSARVEEEFPGYFMLHKRQIEEYDRYLRQQSEARAMAAPTPPVIEGGDCTEEVFDWVESALEAISTGEWAIGRKGLWLVGPTRMGKTIFVNRLAERVPCFFANVREEYVNHFDPNVHRVVVLDEFLGELPLGFVLQLTGGGRATLRTKGGQIAISGHRPCIVCSNLRPMELYPLEPSVRMAALCRRFLVVEVAEPIRLIWSQDPIV